MGSRLSLRKNFSWTLSSHLAFNGCQMLLWMLLAKAFAPEYVGQYALAVAIAMPVLMFSTLQLRNVQATDVRGEFPFGQYLSMRLVTTGLAAVLIFLIAILIFPRGVALTIVLVGVARLVDTVSDVYYGLFQRHERMDIIAKSMILKGLLMILMQYLGIVLAGSFRVGLLLVALAWMGVLLRYDIPHAARMLTESHAAIRPIWSQDQARALFKLAFPLGFMRLLITAASYLPRLFIGSFLGNSVLGIFAAMSSLAIGAGVIANALGQAMLPRLSSLLIAGDSRAFLKVLGKAVIMGAGVGVGGGLVAWLWGEPLLKLFFTPEYAQHTDAFLVAMGTAGLAAIGTLLNAATMAARRYGALVRLYVMVVLASIAACLFLIPGGNVFTSTWTVAVSTAVHLVGSFILVMLQLKRAQQLGERRESSR